MTEDAPYRLPSPVVVGDMLSQAAWDNDIADQHRLVCEMGADTVRQLMVRLMELSRKLELLEADRDNLLTLIDRRLADGHS